jgi:hypothetical protein
VRMSGTDEHAIDFVNGVVVHDRVHRAVRPSQTRFEQAPIFHPDDPMGNVVLGALHTGRIRQCRHAKSSSFDHNWR